MVPTSSRVVATPETYSTACHARARLPVGTLALAGSRTSLEDQSDGIEMCRLGWDVPKLPLQTTFQGKNDFLLEFSS